MRNILDLQVALENAETAERLRALNEVIPLAFALGAEATITELLPYITGDYHLKIIIL